MGHRPALAHPALLTSLDGVAPGNSRRATAQADSRSTCPVWRQMRPPPRPAKQPHVIALLPAQYSGQALDGLAHAHSRATAWNAQPAPPAHPTRPTAPPMPSRVAGPAMGPPGHPCPEGNSGPARELCTSEMQQLVVVLSSPWNTDRQRTATERHDNQPRGDGRIFSRPRTGDHTRSHAQKKSPFRRLVN